MIGRPGTTCILVIKLNYRGAHVSLLRRHLASHAGVTCLAYRRMGSRLRIKCRVLRDFTRGTGALRHAYMPVDGLYVKLGYNNDSNFSNVATGPLIKHVSSEVITVNNSTVLARIPRVFNTRRQLVGGYTDHRILATCGRVVRDFGSFCAGRNFPICRGPDPNGGRNNVAALRRGSLNYVRGTKNAPVISMLNCKRYAGGDNIDILGTPNGSLVTTATLTTTNYRVILFAANENAPFSAFAPAVGLSSGGPLTRFGDG